MRTFRDTIEGRIRQLEKLIEVKRNSISRAPEGSLRVTSSHGSVQFCRNGIYIAKKDGKMVRLLAQKDYDKLVLKNAEEELRVLNRLLSDLPEKIVEEIYEEQLPVRKEMIKPIILPDAEFIYQWQNEPYVKKPFDDNYGELFTNRGERVRSKSEKLIADQLDKYGIPYKYECPLADKNGRVIHPDFTVLNVRTREVFYWEHCGKLDSPIYARDLDSRVRFYGSLGIYPGAKLILTTETSERPIDMRIVEAMIKKILL